jgi:hypothetical protein
MKKEVFKVIKWLTLDYEIGDRGTVFSLKNGKRTPITPVLTNKGYYAYCLYINGKPKKFFAHRLVYMAHKGPIPEGRQIDHINGIKTDNRVSNLEPVTNRDNTIRYRNTDAGRCKSSGHVGVYWDEDRNKWQVCLHVGGTRLHLGRFDKDKFDEACAAQEKAYAEEISGNLSQELQARLDRLIENRLKRKKAS